MRPLAPADHARWDAYVLAHPGSHFTQRVAWKELTEAEYGCPAHWWLAERDGRVCGVLPLFEKRGRHPALFSPSGGLLADDPAVAEALLAPAAERVRRGGYQWLELRDQMARWPGLATNDEHLTLVLELAGDAAAQWKAFDAKLRNLVRKAEKAGLTGRRGHALLGAFHRVMLENMRDLGTPIRNTGYYRAVLERYGADADILVVDRGAVPVGAMFVVRHGATLADPWASSLRRFFACAPNYMLYWTALQHAIALGLERFDFGRSQWGSNTFRFKEQWGAKPVPLHYQYVLGRATRFPTLADQKGSFDLAVRAWKRLPLPLARVLGDPVKRLFPEAL